MIAPLFFALAAFSTKAYAQDLQGLVSGLSSSCQVAASGLLASPLTSCANVLGLVSVISASGSVVQPVNSWISGICSTEPCSQTDLTAAHTSVSTGCAEDINSGNQAALALNLLTSNYTQLRDVTCLQARSNQTFCLTNFLTAVESSTGQPITKDFVVDLFQTPDSVISVLSSMPASSLCTDCDKAVIGKVHGLLDANAGSSLNSAASDKCGAAFVDGTIPTTVAAAGSGGNSAGMNLRSPLSFVGSLALVAAGAFLLA